MGAFVYDIYLCFSVLRALGIGTRSITNFESAHDCDASVTIDYHWNEDDEAMKDLNDSVWFVFCCPAYTTRVTFIRDVMSCMS